MSETVEIAPRDDGSMGVLVSGEGWAIASSFTTEEGCRRFAEAVIVERRVRTGNGTHH